MVTYWILAIPCLVVIVVFSLFIWGRIYRQMSPDCPSDETICGKTVIITGSSAGIGKTTAEELARRGGRIILACRNLIKAQKVADNIKEKTGNLEIIVMKLDTSDLRLVKEFVNEFRKNEIRLDILINNAGCSIQERSLSPQGFELCYATNHLGHFLLTTLLLDMIKDGDPGRILNVSSSLHKFSGMQFDDIQFEHRKYTQLSSYSQSKLCNIYFTNELSKRVEGTGVTVNCIHPGVVNTEFHNKNNTFREKIVSLVFQLIGKDAVKGAQTTVYLAVAKEVSGISGEYFVDCKIDIISNEAKNADNAKRLWEISEKQISENI